MQILKRIFALALGSAATFGLAVLVSSSSSHGLEAKTITPAFSASTIGSSERPVAQEALVGDVASAPTPETVLSKVNETKYQWFACPEDVPASSHVLTPGCEAIQGANGANLVLTSAEVGKHVLFSMSAGNGPVTFSAATEAAVSPAPTLSAAPTGLNKSLKFVAATSPALNSKITVNRGSWPAAGTGYSVSYEWLRCQDAVTASATAPANCVAIDGATASSYVVTANDLGLRIVTHVTASLNGVTSEVWTSSIGPVYKAVKYYKGASVGPGTGTYPYLVGNAVTAAEGTWDGPPNFTYQWYSCTAKVAASATLNKLCKVVAGATTDSFTPTPAQNGKYLMVRISGSTPLAATVITTYSAGSTKVLDDPTNKTVAKLPATAPQVGASISLTAGVWTGSPAPTLSYQWYACDTDEAAAGADKPDDCSAISGATGTSFTPTQELYGKFLLVEEKATSLAGTDSIFSATSTSVVSKPVYESDPLVLGTVELGQVLTATNGAGTGSLADTTEYQWLACASSSPAVSAKPANCTPIQTATNAEYALSRTVEGSYLAVQVTLVNQVGRTVRVSATTADFVRTAPTLDSGDLAPATDPVSGVAFSAPSGLWRGAPTPTFAYQWLVCDTDGAKAVLLPSGCAEIPGATSASFTPTHAQAASYLRVRIRASNDQGSYVIWSAASTVVKERPTFIGSPVLSSGALVGTPIQVSETSTNGVPVPTNSIAWYQCKSQVLANANSAPASTNCSVIPNQSLASYTPTSADLDKYIGALVTSTNSLGSTIVFTATSAKIQAAPVLLNNPAGPGAQGVSPKVGSSVAASSAVWVGSPTPVPNYQWYSCADVVLVAGSAMPDVCIEIAGATSNAFVPTVQEVDRYLMVRLGASNSIGASYRFTPTSAVVQEAPNFTVDPTIYGGNLTGDQLAFDMLFTRGSPEPAVSYSWYRCDAAITAVQATTTCPKISGAIGDTYTLTPADLDKYISGAATLTSALGTVTKITASSAKVQGAPALTGTLPAPSTAAVKVDSAITMPATVWTGSPQVVLSYQWFSCPAAISASSSSLDARCYAIAGATSTSFTPTIAQVGKFLVLRITGTNSIGTVTLYTPSTSAVNETPSFQGDTSIDDVNLVGRIVTLTLPATRGFPTPTPTYVWYRCTAAVGFSATTVPNTCTVITGATAATYTLDTPDLDKFVLAGVTLTNATGSATKYSPSTVMIQGLPKLSNTLGMPSSTLVGVTSPRIGVVENAPTNVWTGSPKPSVSLQWVRCQDVSALSSTTEVPCDDIAGATATTYTPTVADKGLALRVRITATNTLGTTTIWSGSTQKTQQPPTFASDPTLNSFITVNDLLRVNPVSQIAYPVASESYSWYRCNAPILTTTTTAPLSTVCTLLVNESVSTHPINNQDVDNYLMAKVTLTNEAGSVSIFTATTAKIISAPIFDQEPTVAGQSYVTGKLILAPFTVSAKPAAKLSYQWYLCTRKVMVSFADVQPGCTAISGATTDTYYPTEDTVDNYISVLVTATNVAGQVTSFSKTTAAILMPPKNLVAPQVSGLSVVGNPLVTDTGTWTPSSNVTFDYRWFACSKPTVAADTISTTDCKVVVGSTTNRFTTAAAQVGSYMVAEVTAKNFTINVPKYTASTEIIADYPAYVSGMGVAFAAGQASTSGAPRVGYKISAVEGTFSGTPAPSYIYQWFVCTNQRANADKSLTPDCREINGATTKEFEITPQLADDYNLVGKYLGVKVTASNKAGQDFAYSATSAKTVTMPPQLVTAPELSGYRYVDAVLSGTMGTFTGTPATTETQAWWQCDVAIPAAVTVQPAGCTKLVPTTPTIKLALAMKGKFITTATISTNDAGTLTVWAASLTEVTTGAINTSPPTIGVNPIGVPKVGGTLTANHGVWSGDPALTEASYTYQWYSCATEIKVASFTLDQSAECLRVGDAVNTTYQPVRDDAGRFILVSVTGTNSQGGSRIFSASTSKVNLAPENVIAPVQTGTAFVGTRQSVGDGTWLGVPAPTFSYQWLICDSEQLLPPTAKPADCAVIPGATSNIYGPLISQVGQFLMVQVTATNVAGSAVAYSLTSDDIKSAPVNTTPPAVVVSNGTVGLPVANQSTLSTSGGIWQGRPTPTLEFQWFSCAVALTASADDPAADKDCKPVTDRAKGITYDPVTSDRARFIAVKVFATNIHATVSYWSATTSVVNMAPLADVVPEVSGVAFVQAIVSASADTWLAHPAPTKAYQWLSCGELQLPSACTVISGASAPTFTIPSNLEGRSLIVKVTASNQFGSAVSYSLASAKITTGPVSTAAQTISGSVAYPPAAGAVLSTNDGTWAGNPRPTLSYQWYRCSALVAASAFALDPKCSPIADATSNTYALADVDPGNSLVVGITGTNTWGTSTRYSASTAIVTEKVHLITPPALTSSAKIGQAITADEGTWRGFPSPTTTYSWYSCTVANTAAPVQIAAATGVGVVPPNTCTKIQGANRASLEVSDSQLGKMLIFMVTKSNTVDTTTTTINAYTQSSLPAAQPPISLAKPVLSSPTAVSGTNPKVGSVWNVSSGLWADPQPIKTYQWYRCDTAIATGPTPITTLPGGCVAISGATGTSYTIMAEDSGKFISIEAIATNAADTLHQWSNSTLSVLQVPIAITPPTISGERQRGKTLTADPGIWTGNPTPVITYQWYSCKTAFGPTSTTPQLATNCSQISGETSATYVQSPAGSDDGKFITATVSGTSGTSDPTVYWVSVANTDATAQAPSVIALPTVGPKSGNSAVGDIFSIEDDRWIGAPAPTFSYKWYACDTPNIPAGTTLPAGCTIIDGATGQTFVATIALADSKKYLMGAVTATNLAGTATVYSKSYSAIIDKGILNTAPATIASTSLVIPASITGTSGTWSSGTELKISHRWYACPYALTTVYSYIPFDCFPIRPLEVGTVTPLNVVAADEVSGDYIVLYEKVEQKIDATKWQKVRERLTQTTGQILEAPALRLGGAGFVTPAVEQDVVVGYATTAINGAWVAALNAETSYTWRGAQVGTFTYQWFSCASSQASYNTSALPAGCSYLTTSPTRPTTNASFVPNETEIGAFVGVRITATNASGSLTVWTNTSRAVTQEVTNINRPVLGDAFVVDDRLTLAGGLQTDWKGTPAPALTVDWFTCTLPHTSAPATLPTDCTGFVNATSSPNTGITIPLERSLNTQYLMARVTGANTPWVAANRTSSVSLFSATSKRIMSRPYINTLIANPNPSLSGTADVGSILSITPGNWLGSMPIKFSGRWFACDTAAPASTQATPAAGCVLFKQDTQSVLLTHAQVGKYIVGQMVAVNDAGTTYQSAAASVKVLEPPTIVSPPEVTLVDPALASGKNEVGQRLGINPATWDGSPAPTSTSRFYACDTAYATAGTSIPGNCSLVAGVAGSVLTLGDAEAGKHIVVVSTATNTTNGGTKSTVSVSASMGPVYRTPYFDTVTAPSISGTAHVGFTLNFTKTTVKGYEVPTTSYAWFICENAVSSVVNDSVPAGCSAIAATANAPLIVPAAAAGKYVLGIQTASATWTSVTATRSTVTTAQITSSPSVQSAPSLSGDDYVGGAVKVSADKGTWSSFPAITDLSKYSISILQCDSPNVAGTAVPTGCAATALATFTGAAPQQFTPTSTQAGKYLVAKVIATAATNKSASDAVTYYSSSLGPIREAATLPGQPTITSGTVPEVGSTLSMVTTTPKGFPVNTPTYDWYLCPATAASVPTAIPVDCELQAAASSKSFTLPATAAGKYVLGWVTAANELGSVSKATAYSNIVKMAPVNKVAPVLSGGDEVGNTITSTTGAWSSTPDPVFTYQWYACTSAASTIASGCTAIGASTSSATFTPGEAQAGKYIMANVTATTAIYSGNVQAVKSTTNFGPIRMPATVKAAPTISGYAHVGETMNFSLTQGSLAGYPSPVYSYEWYACDTAPAATIASIPNGCSLIPGFTKAPLVVDAAYAGKFIIAAVTATNYSTYLRTSAASLAVTSSLVNATAPTLSGDLFVGGTAVTSTPGTWSSTPAVNAATDVTYTFYSCATSAWSAATCTQLLAANVSGATVTLNSAMQGKYIVGRVNATIQVNKPGSAGSVTVSTNAIGPVEAAPSFTAVPSTPQAVFHVGSVITASSTGELGVPAPAKTYAWFFCSAPVATSVSTMPAGCSAADPSIDGQSAITLPAEAAGKYVSVLVTLENRRGKVSASSLVNTITTATPSISVNPVLSGDDFLAANKSLSVTDGTWLNAPATANRTFAYSWFACPTAQSAIANCAYLGDTPTRTNAISEAMVDKFIVAKVTVSVSVNKTGAGTAIAYSNASGRIRKSAVLTANPVVSGYMNIGETVVASNGSPSGVPAPTVAYAWYVCTSPVAASVTTAPTGCVIDNSSVTSSYVIPQSAAGSYILAIAKASSDQDLATVYRSSVSTLAVSSGAVIGATVPAITGTTVLGSTALALSNGTWSWKPSALTATYSYRWFACASTVTLTAASSLPATGCTLIANQSAGTLTLTTAELGYKIVGEVTVTVATNTATPSKTTYYTATTPKIVMQLPAAGSTPPSIDYTTLTVGSVLKVKQPGTWTGSPAPVPAYTWYTCPATTTQPTNKQAPATCTALTVKGDLTLLSTYKGLKILLLVIASNDAGSASNVSALVTVQ